MSYFVLCTFDLKNATSGDYSAAYEELAALGLQRTVTGDDGSVVPLPNTCAAGSFHGAGHVALRDDLTKRITGAFAARGLTSEVFILVSGNWAWFLEPGSPGAQG